MDTREPARPNLFVIINNHFDPTWRRCWARRFTVEGQTYASYADLQAYYMLDNLALARQYAAYKFEAESSFIARKFLERHPETREALVQLAAEGRFGITGGGETIVDSNMILGESLIRNYLVGLLWVERTFGQRTRHAVRNDAFGNSAQLPQILRGCEIPWATGMSYTRAQGLYWRGLDGSTILHATLPVAAQGGGNTKYRPCPVCVGTGSITGTAEGDACPVCDGRGIDDMERAWLPATVPADAAQEAWSPFNAALVPIVPEELLPNPELLKWVEAQRERFDVAFTLEEELYPYVQAWIDEIDRAKPKDVHPGVELNPNNTGCWVTRIKTKQTCRRREYALLGIETFAVMAALHGNGYPATELDALWQAMFFTMFHDAITATHVDPAYAELQEIWVQIDRRSAQLRRRLLSGLLDADPETLAVLNPHANVTTNLCTVTLDTLPKEATLIDEEGQPVPLLETHQEGEGPWRLTFLAKRVPAFGARHYRWVSDSPREAAALPAMARLAPAGTGSSAVAREHAVIETTRFRIEADRSGITEIYDKQLARTVAATATFRPLELVLEHDEGSPWATLHPDQQRIRLAPFTRLQPLEDGPQTGGAVQRLAFEVKTPREMGFSGGALHAIVTVALVEGLDRIEIDIKAHWDAFSHRVRVAVPVPFAGRHVYEIPYGMLTRTPYEPHFSWAGANGDWPAINWAGVESDGAAVALFNKGVPSYRMEPVAETESSPAGELLLISLLRSPTLPTYLHEPEFYTMTAWDGMRDAGDHAFQLALAAYHRPFAESTVVSDAESFNAGLLGVPGRAHLPALPTLGANAVRLAAIKWAEEGNALILRLHEYRGVGGEAVVALPFPVASAAKVNMLERQPQPLAVDNHTLTLTLRPWEIATVRLEL